MNEKKEKKNTRLEHWKKIAIVIAPPGEAQPASEQDADAALAEALTRLPVGRAASEVAKALGLDRKTLYARALVMKGDASEA